MCFHRHLNEYVKLTIAQWTSVLDLAHMWGFDQVRAVAINHLSKQPLTSFRKVVLSQKYDITEWYEDAYVRLAQRAQPLSVEEAHGLGLEPATKIAHVREESYLRGTVKCGKIMHQGEFRYHNSYSIKCDGSMRNAQVEEGELRDIEWKVFHLDARWRLVARVFLSPKPISYVLSELCRPSCLIPLTLLIVMVLRRRKA